jgi:hypothetical protein
VLLDSRPGSGPTCTHKPRPVQPASQRMVAFITLPNLSPAANPPVKLSPFPAPTSWWSMAAALLEAQVGSTAGMVVTGETLTSSLLHLCGWFLLLSATDPQRQLHPTLVRDSLGLLGKLPWLFLNPRTQALLHQCALCQREV